MTELTDKQLKALAEFLGRNISLFATKSLIENDRGKLTDAYEWIYGNDGQSALMDKLIAMKVRMEIVPWGIVKKDYCCFGLTDKGVYSEGKGDTRQEALINAILDTLGANNV